MPAGADDGNRGHQKRPLFRECKAWANVLRQHSPMKEKRSSASTETPLKGLPASLAEIATEAVERDRLAPSVAGAAQSFCGRP